MESEKFSDICGTKQRDMKTIKRTIFVDSLEEIDFSNVGVHFTSDLGYDHKGGGSNGLTVQKGIKVTFFLKDYIVNKEATSTSNEGYPNEKEVVLEFNQECLATVYIQRKTMLGGYGRVEETTKKINIGTRCDLWVENM